ncbi:MAG: hypothetical protein H6587_06010 [Flavobacteriales bacterium]|nr:hypothetical protein [Flavobacteriales bacterium]
MLQQKSILIDKGMMLSSFFPNSIFWDCDISNFNLDNWEDRSFIIQRVLKMSYLQDDLLVKLESIFPIEEIKYYAEGSAEIVGNERIDMLCKRYNMQPSQFPNYFQNLVDFMYA